MAVCLLLFHIFLSTFNISKHMLQCLLPVMLSFYLYINEVYLMLDSALCLIFTVAGIIIVIVIGLATLMTLGVLVISVSIYIQQKTHERPVFLSMRYTMYLHAQVDTLDHFPFARLVIIIKVLGFNTLYKVHTINTYITYTLMHIHVTPFRLFTTSTFLLLVYLSTSNYIARVLLKC